MNKKFLWLSCVLVGLVAVWLAVLPSPISRLGLALPGATDCGYKITCQCPNHIVTPRGFPLQASGYKSCDEGSQKLVFAINAGIWALVVGGYTFFVWRHIKKRRQSGSH